MPFSHKKNRWILVISALVIITIIAFDYWRNRAQTLDAATAESYLKTGTISHATIDGPYLYFQSSGIRYKVPKEAIDPSTLYRHTAVTIHEPNPYLADMLLLAGLGILVIYLVRWAKKNREFRERQMNEQLELANALQKPADIQPIVSDVNFSDVAGIDEVKEELEEIIDFLRHPRKYLRFGVRMPRGVLLIGPPGVGKTLIAKAVAGEAGVPFFYQSGASFVQIYVGMGAKRVRELFHRAKATAPAIIFIDEIDAVGKARGGMRNDEREATLNQLLTEMDGFEDSSGVIVIAATNKIEMLDDALLRPGRFDRRIFVSLPSKEERHAILRVYLANKPHRVDLDKIAQMTVGFSGAALSSLVNEAAIYALRQGKALIEMEDFMAVKEKVLLGKRKILTFSEKEKEIQSIYQAAKAAAAWWFGVDFAKIGLLGDHFRQAEKEIVSQTEMMNRLKVLLSGSAMMQHHYHELFSNGADDLKEARLIAQEMVEHFGMGESLLPDSAAAHKLLQKANAEAETFVAKAQEGIVQLAQKMRQKEKVEKADVELVMHAIF